MQCRLTGLRQDSPHGVSWLHEVLGDQVVEVDLVEDDCQHHWHGQADSKAQADWKAQAGYQPQSLKGSPSGQVPMTRNEGLGMTLTTS